MDSRPYLRRTQGFNVPWPSALNALTTFMAVLNFNMDAVSPACVNVRWTYTESAWLSMLLPLIFGFFSLCKVLLGWLWMKRVGARTVHGVRLPFFIVTADELDALRRQSLASWLHRLIMLYNSVCVAIFQAFYCIDLPGGDSVLRVDPDVQCGTPGHRSLMAVSMVGIVFFVLGLPSFLAYKLYTMQQHNTLKDKRNIAAWGELYTPFENGFWFWPIIILTRRLVLCFLVVALFDAPQFQLAIGVTVTILWICLQYFARPFKVGALDLLDAAGVLSLALYMVAGFVFASTNFGGQYFVSREAIEWTTVALIFSTSATVALGFIGR